MTEVKTRKKLIEVALPLDAINAASAREKSIRHGHPSTLHLWWARRPLAAARAVIFAQMVDDPSSHPERFPTSEEQDAERQRLFDIIEELVVWENTTNEEVLEKARAEIRRSWRWTCEDNKDHPQAAELFDPDKPPAFHDPFAGGGSLPLEAQRLGLESNATDLNPVAVLINKAMIEVPPKFAGLAPVNPASRKEGSWLTRPWSSVEGLAQDVRYYGQWMRDEIEKRIGHLYPKVKITDEAVAARPDLEPYRGRELTVIAWIWTRTVRSPNPAFADTEVPLASTFMLTAAEDQQAWVHPVLEGNNYRFEVRVGAAENPEAVKVGTKLGRGASFRCLLSETPIDGAYIKAEGVAGRIGARPMAVVAEGDRERVFLPPPESVPSPADVHATSFPDIELSGSTQYLGVKPYGITRVSQLFSARQHAALSAFGEAVTSARAAIEQDARSSGASDPAAYASAVALYLGLVVGRCANYWSRQAAWGGGFIVQSFGRQAIPMLWDFAEGNPFSSSTGNWTGAVEWVAKVIEGSLPALAQGSATQADASSEAAVDARVVSTDPPYFDNVPYADLSDFFYYWLRRPLRPLYPDLLSTLAVPKKEELVAFAYRHPSKKAAEEFFVQGMTAALRRLVEKAHPCFPVTVYYAFRQAETDGDDAVVSTGWDTFLEAAISAGFAITGTWPVRTERGGGFRNKGRNSLASSIVLVCRRREEGASAVSRRDFLSLLKSELATSLAHLQRCNIAPVDLAQAAIGPGMAVYTRYSRVLESSGTSLGVRAALALINHVLDESLAEQEGDFDSDTRWALAWFEEHRFAQGDFGTAETLSTAKNTSVRGIEEAGILVSKPGKVRLLRPSELPEAWDPQNDSRLTTWECVHHLIRVLEADGEEAAAALTAKLGSHADSARELAYRLYAICERKKWASEAKAYNSLVVSWSAIESLLGSTEATSPASQKQQDLPGM